MHLKQNQEFKELIIDQTKQLQQIQNTNNDLQKQLLEVIDKKWLNKTKIHNLRWIIIVKSFGESGAKFWKMDIFKMSIFIFVKKVSPNSVFLKWFLP